MFSIVFRLLQDQKKISKPRSQLDKLRKATGIKAFSLHDPRRSFAHHAGRYGSDFYLTKKSLNHRSGDITDAYIDGTVEMIRPVFGAVARGFLTYFNEDLVFKIYSPEATAKQDEEFLEHMKQTGEKQGTPRL